MANEMKNIYLDGFSIADYRSFIDVQLFGPLSKINLFIGKNNSGKSNILNYIHNHLQQVFSSLQASHEKKFQDIDRPLSMGLGERALPVYLGLSLNRLVSDKYYQNLIEKIHCTPEEIKDFLTLEAFKKNDDEGFAWFEYELQKDGKAGNPKNLDKIPDDSFTQKIIERFFSGNLGLQRATRHVTNKRAVFEKLSPLRNSNIPKSHFVPAIREIAPGKLDEANFNGKGIINWLAEIQIPDHDQLYKKEIFEQIVSFVKDVTGEPDAKIQVTRSNQIQIIFRDKVLPLSNIGMGIHEVVILAAAATREKNSIFCIEEPEIHLHPSMQKKLLRYLFEKTNNQYFIATHSVHLLDAVPASIFHITLKNDCSVSAFVKSDKDRSTICNDLGYRASDLIQSNCIIWVEGPSDRIYLNHWIKAVDSNIVEGLHYSIMFYGGRLLSHLSADDPEIDEFISLRRLNRNIVVVMDSDKNTESEEPNDTKKRVKEECDIGPGFGWITYGREIENYIPFNLMKTAIEQTHKGVKQIANGSIYHDITKFQHSSGELKPIDKIKVAKAVTRETADLSSHELKGKIDELIAFINKSNRLEK